MSTQRHIAYTIAGAAILALSAQAEAGRLQKPGWLPSSPWGIGIPPVIHTNQDGPMGANVPVGPWSEIAAHGLTLNGGGSILTLIIDLQAEELATGWEDVSSTSPLTTTPVTDWTPETPKGIPGTAPVPAPGVLGLLGLAGLAASPRRRR